MDLINFSFVNWDKYNSHKVKRPHWFALSNRITEDDKIQTLNSREFRVLIHLMCVSSLSKSYRVGHELNDITSISLSKVVRTLSIRKKFVLAAIEKIEELEIIRIIWPLTRQDKTRQYIGSNAPNGALHVPIEQTEQEEIKARLSSKFDAFWQEYRDQIFKRRGVKIQLGAKAKERFLTQFKTFKEVDVFFGAAENYLEYLTHPENEWRLPKQTLAAFIGTKSSGFFWRDFIQEPDGNS